MSKYELAIAVVDEQDHTLGKYRKKEGDIIALKSYPCHWGKKEIGQYLIVIVDLPGTLQEEGTRLTIPYYEGGVTDDSQAPVLAKRRYRIDLAGLLIDKVKMKNKSYIYQPYKKASQIVEKFDGKNGNYLLTKGDVDCTAIGIAEEQEKALSSTLIEDKHLKEKK